MSSTVVELAMAGALCLYLRVRSKNTRENLYCMYHFFSVTCHFNKNTRCFSVPKYNHNNNNNNNNVTQSVMSKNFSANKTNAPKRSAERRLLQVGAPIAPLHTFLVRITNQPCGVLFFLYTKTHPRQARKSLSPTSVVNYLFPGKRAKE